MKVQQVFALLAAQAIGGVFAAPVPTPVGKKLQKHFLDGYIRN
jgi:hypothetical protein